jgi:hypothetical protein
MTGKGERGGVIPGSGKDDGFFLICESGTGSIDTIIYHVAAASHMFTPFFPHSQGRCLCCLFSGASVERAGSTGREVRLLFLFFTSRIVLVNLIIQLLTGQGRARYLQYQL